MKIALFSILLASTLLSGFCQTLKVDDNNRYLVYQDGRPFFWLGDTAWELFHRTTTEEAELYLTNRAAKGFNVIQAVVLAELDGLNTPSSMGEKPLINNDPAKPNDTYFTHVDFIVSRANELGMFIGMLPTWGDKFNIKWGKGPEIFTPKNAYTYGKYLATRYRGKGIIWILGGDRNPDDDEDIEIINEMARGIREVTGQSQLITMHPQGGATSSTWFHQEEWLDFNMFQSGHGDVNNKNYLKTQKDYGLDPVKPVLDGEPCYEDHPVSWNASNGWFDEFDSRRAGYWSMLSGALGHTYGNHNIWQMWLPGREAISAARTPWKESLDYPGAFQAGYMKAFFEPYDWQSLVPAQQLLKSGPSTNGKDVRVASGNNFIMAYSPYGSDFSLDLSALNGVLSITWFDPSTGMPIYTSTPLKGGNQVAFDPPADEARGNDWVLVVQGQ